MTTDVAISTHIAEHVAARLALQGLTESDAETLRIVAAVVERSISTVLAARFASVLSVGDTPSHPARSQFSDRTSDLTRGDA